MIATPRAVVVLTGAGISAESGIRTFRAADGLWEEHRVEDVASPDGFARDPDLVYNFYNQRRRQLVSDEIRPNAAHEALARFEEAFDGDFLLVTQNIDDLHERAGSRKLLHMHGELLKMRCMRTHQLFPTRLDFDASTSCRCCGSAGNLRPHVVWFGEMPLYMREINEALQQCDLFISIGTSGNVYPASGFYQTAKIHRAQTVELNLERTPSSFDLHRTGPASELVPAFLDELAAQVCPGPAR